MTNVKTMMEEMAQEELERDGAACVEAMQSRKSAGAHGKMWLIDADALLNAIKKADKADPELAIYWCRGSISRTIKQLPTVDAVEVVHGKLDNERVAEAIEQLSDIRAQYDYYNPDEIRKCHALTFAIVMLNDVLGEGRSGDV